MFQRNDEWLIIPLLSDPNPTLLINYRNRGLIEGLCARSRSREDRPQKIRHLLQRGNNELLFLPPVYGWLSTSQFLFFFSLLSGVLGRFISSHCYCSRTQKKNGGLKKRKKEMKCCRHSGNAELQHARDALALFAYVKKWDGHKMISGKKKKKKKHTQGRKEIKLDVYDVSGQMQEEERRWWIPVGKESAFAIAFWWSFLIREMGTNTRLAPLRHESNSQIHAPKAPCHNTQLAQYTNPCNVTII